MFLKHFLFKLVFFLHLASGLCGNFDGDKDNDLVTKAGKVVNKKQPDEFSREWRSVMHFEDFKIQREIISKCNYSDTVWVILCVQLIKS